MFGFSFLSLLLFEGSRSEVYVCDFPFFFIIGVIIIVIVILLIYLSIVLLFFFFVRKRITLKITGRFLLQVLIFLIITKSSEFV